MCYAVLVFSFSVCFSMNTDAVELSSSHHISAMNLYQRYTELLKCIASTITPGFPCISEA